MLCYSDHGCVHIVQLLMSNTGFKGVGKGNMAHTVVRPAGKVLDMVGTTTEVVGDHTVTKAVASRMRIGTSCPLSFPFSRWPSPFLDQPLLHWLHFPLLFSLSLSLSPRCFVDVDAATPTHAPAQTNQWMGRVCRIACWPPQTQAKTW